MLLFNEIEKIEVAFRAAVVNTITDRTGDIFWMTNPSYVNAGTLALIQREYAHSTVDFILHFKNGYSNPYPPAWILSEILPFGNITWIFRLPTEFQDTSFEFGNLAVLSSPPVHAIR